MQNPEPKLATRPAFHERAKPHVTSVALPVAFVSAAQSTLWTTRDIESWVLGEVASKLLTYSSTPSQTGGSRLHAMIAGLLVI